jgi:hypothetical protein
LCRAYQHSNSDCVFNLKTDLIMYCIAYLEEEDKKLNPHFNETLRSLDRQRV